MNVFENAESTEEEILAAAYQALNTHGYADLTMERIGEKFDKSVSLVYHHYDSKDDLLLACLEFMLESYRADTDEDCFSDPRAGLERLCDRLVLTEAPSKDQQFVRTLTELRGQAPHNQAYRDYFTRSDHFFQSQIETIVEAGIEQGVFHDVDPERTAEMIQTIFNGVFCRFATSGDDAWVSAVREELRAYNERTLYRQDAEIREP